MHEVNVRRLLVGLVLAIFACFSGAAFAFSVSASFSPGSIPVNGATRLTFTLYNNAGVAGTGVAFTDTLPAGLVIATPNGLDGNCLGTITANSGTTTISLSGGSIPGAGLSCEIFLNIIGTTAGQYTNTTSAITSTNEGTGAAGTANLTVTAPVLTIQKTGPGNVYAGNNVTYTIVVGNTGNGAATNVMLTDPTPAGLTFVSATPPCTSGFPCNLATLNAPGTVTVTATYNIATTATGSITNIASVQSDQTAATNASASTGTGPVPIPTPALGLRGLLLLGLTMLLGGVYWKRRQAAACRY